MDFGALTVDATTIAAGVAAIIACAAVILPLRFGSRASSMASRKVG